MTDQNQWLTRSQAIIATETVYAQEQFEYIQKRSQGHRPV